MKKKFFALSLPVLILFFAGCASQTVNGKFPLSGYNAFEVMPVSNDTGEIFDSDVAAEITRHIILRLRQEGFNIAETPGSTVIIKTSLTYYEVSRTGRATCTIKSMLIDKRTGKGLGEILTTRSVTVGGLSQLGLEADRAVLEMAVEDIVTQLERKTGARR